MNAAKLTLITLSAATIMLGGCSNDNSLLGPVSDVQSGIGIDQTGRLADNSGRQNPEPNYFTIVAQVQSLDVENGCFYLESEEEGMTYTPIAPKDLVLETGLELKVKGYIDNNIQLFCGNGPAFVIKKYSIISKPKMSEGNGDSELKAGDPTPNQLSNPVKPGDKEQDKNPDLRTIEGLVKITKEGCIVLATAAKEEYVLDYESDIPLKTGARVRATGYISALPYFACYEAPIFVAEKVSIVRSSSESKQFVQPKNEIAPTMPKDNGDRQLTYTKDKRSAELELEHQKKLKKERKIQGENNKRP